jgi:ligand-binding SRPBCC domain-containing protein
VGPAAFSLVFPLFSAVENLERLTPSWLRFELSPLPIEMQAGALIDYRIRPYGVAMRWRTLIRTWELPLRFGDEQLSGPYAVWLARAHLCRAQRWNDDLRSRPLSGTAQLPVRSTDGATTAAANL